MNNEIIHLVIAMVVIALAIWSAKEAPAPFSYILWGAVVLIVLFLILDVAHVRVFR